MAAEIPGWCRLCGEPLEHAARIQGRAKEFCDATCRQRYHRGVKLRATLQREVGLASPQVDRLLTLFKVSARSMNATDRDVDSSRKGSQIGRLTGRPSDE